MVTAYNGRVDWKSGLVYLYNTKDGVPYVHQIVGEWLSWHKKPVEGAFKRHIKYQQKDRSHWLVAWRSKEARESCCKAMGEDALEADVNPLTNILRRAEEFKLAPIRKGYFDIETDDRGSFQQTIAGGSRILCLSIKTSDGKMHSFLLKEDTDEAEKEMLDQFIEVLEICVDMAIGWNSSNFDDLVVMERCRMLGCNMKVFQRLLLFDMMLNFKKHNLNSAESGEEKQSVALNNVSVALGESISEKDIAKDPRKGEIKKLLLEGKKDLGGEGIYEMWVNNPQKLLAYNVRDVDLMPLIEEVSGYIELQISVCELCRLFPNTASINASRFVDSFMLRLGHELDYRFPSKWHDELKQVEPFKGAFCLLPTELGIHRDVHVFDFSALYPSVFKTWNLSPETKLGKGEDLVGAKCPLTGFVFSTTKKGIYPIAFERLQMLRKEWQRREEAAEPESAEQKYFAKMSMGTKVVVNSAYGIISSVFGRYHDQDIGESCTQNGAYLIKHVMDELTRKGMTVLTGDTDAAQFKGCTVEEAKILAKYLNEEYIPKLVIDCGCVENHCKMEHEKSFSWVVYSTNGKGASIKKRYVGQYSIFRGKPVEGGKPVIRGLEYRRGDSVKLAREMQYQIFTMLCAHKFDSMPYEEMVLRWRKRIMEEPLAADDIVMSKSINRALGEYKPNKAGGYPIHVRLAKAMEEDDEDVGEGTRIRFYIKDGSKSPKVVALINEYNNDVDRHYLWERVYEPSLRILSGAFNKIPWEHFRAKRPKPILPGQLALGF